MNRMIWGKKSRQCDYYPPYSEGLSLKTDDALLSVNVSCSGQINGQKHEYLVHAR